MKMEKIGDATLYCGDCLDILPEIEPVDIICADPPYSSGGLMRSDRNGSVSEKYVQTATLRKFVNFSGDNRDQRSLERWYAWWMKLLLARAAPSAVCFCFIDWRNLPVAIDAVQMAGWVYRGIIPWDKKEGCRPQKGCFRSQCEYIIWSTAGKNSGNIILPGFYSYSSPTQREHPTQKPVELIADIIRIRPHGIVLDPFMGSGTTGVAAMRTGHKFIGIEMMPYYFDVACQRLEQEWHSRSLLRSGE